MEGGGTPHCYNEIKSPVLIGLKLLGREGGVRGPDDRTDSCKSETSYSMITFCPVLIFLGNDVLFCCVLESQFCYLYFSW